VFTPYAFFVDSAPGNATGQIGEMAGRVIPHGDRQAWSVSLRAMNNQTQAIRNYVEQLAEDAHALMAATAGVAEEKVDEARKRLAAALERGAEIYGFVRDKEIEGVKAANGAMHEHPYEAIAIGVAVGAFIGCLLARVCSRCSLENRNRRR
jgi:ElaB/YqjD/DUF883 family membrane-anchored ribosome-binding protein